MGPTLSTEPFKGNLRGTISNVKYNLKSTYLNFQNYELKIDSQCNDLSISEAFSKYSSSFIIIASCGFKRLGKSFFLEDSG